MPAIDAQASVGELVRESPNRARVFDAFYVDYCCGGKVSLAEACRRKNVDEADVVEALKKLDATPDEANLVDVDAMGLTELVDHIEQVHHAYLREELPRLERMTEKVARVHGDKNPKLQETRDAFVALQAELEPHMQKEEHILFPLIRNLDSTGNSASTLPLQAPVAANPIRQMEFEHDQAGESLAILRESTEGFTPPDWACNTYRAMLDSLARLEADMHQHIHKENNVLFPKTLEREAQR